MLLNKFEELANLVRLGLAVGVLKINEIRYIFMFKNMVASVDSREFESESFDKRNHIREVEVSGT